MILEYLSNADCKVPELLAYICTEKQKYGMGLIEYYSKFFDDGRYVF